MNWRKKIKRNAVYTLTRTMFWLLNIVPRSLACFAGSLVGLAAWNLLPKERHKTLRHLGLVFQSDLTHTRRYNIGREFFINSGRNLADVIRFKKHYHRELKHLVEVEGLQYFDQAYRRGRGLIGVTGHIGNFELLAVHIANLGYDIAVIGREMYDPRLDQLLVNNRKALGLTNIATTESPRTFLKWLNEGKAVGVLIDNDSFRVRSIHVPAFGRMANTPIGQTVLALRAGAAILPMACLRMPDDRYKIVIRPEIVKDPGFSGEQAIYDVTAKCTKELEGIIRTYPAQWAWNHNRWRTPPKIPLDI